MTPHSCQRILLLLLLLFATALPSWADNVRDTFGSQSFSNNDGSANWAGDWVEGGESDGATQGRVQVVVDGSQQYALRLNGSGRNAQRSANLQGALAVTLSFDYRCENIEGGDEVVVQMSSDGGGSWTSVATLTYEGASYTSVNVDVTTFASATTQVRFVTSFNRNNDTIYIDNVDISYTPASTTISANLLTHWWLDGNGDEYFSGTPAVPIGTPGFADARVCQGFFGDGSGFLSSNVEPVLDLPDQFTAMAWIHPSSLSVPGHDNLYSIFSKDTNFEVHVQANGAVYWWWSLGTLTSPAGTITPGNWYHVALVHSRSGGYQRMYINGVLVASGSYAGAMPVNDDAFLIGGDIATGSSTEISGRRFYGLIDEVRVYDGPLSVAEIQTAMNQSRICQMPAAEWRFDECQYTGAPGEAVDSATGGYPATAFNTVLSGPNGVVQRFADLTDTGVQDNHFELGSYLPMPGPWTVSTWFRTPFTGTHRYHVLGSMNGGGDLLFLDRNSNYQWGTYTLSGATYGTFSFGTLTDGWHHMALVGTGGTVALYLDGSYVETVNRQATGNLQFIGTSYDYVGTPTNAQGFGTPLDEFLVFGSALSASDIAGLYGYQQAGYGYNGRPRAEVTCGGLDHFLITHDGSALTCRPEEVTISACSNADCSTLYAGNLTISLSPAGWVGGDSQLLAGGSDTFLLRHTTAGDVTLGVTSNLPAPSNPTVCQTGSGSSCTMTFHDSGFVLDIPDGRSCELQNATLAAVRKDDATEQCVGLDSFAGTTRSVNFWSSYVDPATGTVGVAVEDTTVSGSDPGTGVPLTFDAQAQAPLTVRYNDAGQVQLDARFTGTGDEAGLVLEGADTFVAAPYRFDVSATTIDGMTPLDNATSSGAPAWRAGVNFPVEVRAVCQDGTMTPNYAWPTAVTAAAPFEPAAGTLGSVGNGSLVTGDFTGGVVQKSMNYSEVGTVTLQAEATGYLGSGIDISGASGTVGRFTPDHFDVVLNIPEFGTTCSGFSYLGRNFTYTTAPVIGVTARSALNATTLNYTGDWWKIDIDAGTLTAEAGSDQGYSTLMGTLNTSALAAITVSDGGNGTGTITFAGPLMYQRELLAPFDAEIRLAVNVLDADGIAYDSNPAAFGAATAGNGIAFDNGKEMRFGRLTVTNAYGSELVNLQVPLRTEYYNGTGFVANTDDSCTALAANQIILTNNAGASAISGAPLDVAPGHPTTGTVATPAFINGDAGFYLTAPGQGGNGSLWVDVDLASLPWLQFDWDGTDQASDGNIFDDSPLGRATFGIFQGSPRLIYLRESVD